jgi:hypothetical protein
MSMFSDAVRCGQCEDIRKFCLECELHRRDPNGCSGCKLMEWAKREFGVTMAQFVDPSFDLQKLWW